MDEAEHVGCSKRQDQLYHLVRLANASNADKVGAGGRLAWEVSLTANARVADKTSIIYVHSSDYNLAGDDVVMLYLTKT